MKVIEECAQELANQLVEYISETLERTVVSDEIKSFSDEEIAELLTECFNPERSIPAMNDFMGIIMHIIKGDKILIKLFIRIIQIPLTIIYFILSFFGSVISGLGWLFGVMIFGATICFWAFGEFDSWYQVTTAFMLSTAIVILPGWLTEFIGEGILFLKRALSELVV